MSNQYANLGLILDPLHPKQITCPVKHIPEWQPANHTSRISVANRDPFPESPGSEAVCAVCAVCAVSRLCVKKVTSKGFRVCTTLFGNGLFCFTGGLEGTCG